MLLLPKHFYKNQAGIEKKYLKFWLWYKLYIWGYVDALFWFYVVTKFILLSIGDLNFSTLNYDSRCTYLDNKNMYNTESKKHMLDLMTFCKMIKPFVFYYQRLIKSYNNMTPSILDNEINLILPQIPRKQKCRIITTSLSSVKGLAYEGISSFLHHKWNKAMNKAVRAMDSKTTIQCKNLM